MTTLASTPSPLVPTLADVSVKRLRHSITDLRGGDQLHLKAPLHGFPKGAVLPIYGFCVCRDAAGNAYEARAYVRGSATAYHNREAVRFPAEHQTEQWFGAFLLYLVEIDLTDHADCLRLERQPAPLVQLLYPEASIRQAA